MLSAAETARRARVLDGLAELYPDAHCELHHEDAFQLLVATILSAQCTDKRVNMVTPELFRRWPDAASLAGANPAELEDVIRTTGFFRNKTKNLLGMARGLVERHGGHVPRTMDEMLALPGVARKTANVVLGTAYGLRTGVVVDTHVSRIANRLGLTKNTDPKKIEIDLMKAIPEEQWIDFSHRIIWHGRRLCTARNPGCERCSLAPDCPAASIPGKTAGSGGRSPEPVRGFAKKRIRLRG